MKNTEWALQHCRHAAASLLCRMNSARNLPTLSTTGRPSLTRRIVREQARERIDAAVKRLKENQAAATESWLKALNLTRRKLDD